MEKTDYVQVQPGEILIRVEPTLDIQLHLTEISRHCKLLKAGVEALRYMGRSEETISSTAVIARRMFSGTSGIPGHYESFEHWLWGERLGFPGQVCSEDQLTDIEETEIERNQNIRTERPCHLAPGPLANMAHPCGSCLVSDEVD